MVAASTIKKHTKSLASLAEEENRTVDDLVRDRVFWKQLRESDRDVTARRAFSNAINWKREQMGLARLYLSQFDANFETDGIKYDEPESVVTGIKKAIKAILTPSSKIASSRATPADNSRITKTPNVLREDEDDSEDESPKQGDEAEAPEASGDDESEDSSMKSPSTPPSEALKAKTASRAPGFCAMTLLAFGVLGVAVAVGFVVLFGDGSVKSMEDARSLMQDIFRNGFPESVISRGPVAVEE